MKKIFLMSMVSLFGFGDMVYGAAASASDTKLAFKVVGLKDSAGSFTESSKEAIEGWFANTETKMREKLAEPELQQKVRGHQGRYVSFFFNGHLDKNVQYAFNGDQIQDTVADLVFAARAYLQGDTFYIEYDTTTASVAFTPGFPASHIAVRNDDDPLDNCNYLSI